MCSLAGYCRQRSTAALIDEISGQGSTTAAMDQKIIANLSGTYAGSVAHNAVHNPPQTGGLLRGNAASRIPPSVQFVRVMWCDIAGVRRCRCAYYHMTNHAQQVIQV